MRPHLEGIAAKNDIWLVVGLMTVLIGGAFGYAYLRITALDTHATALSGALASTTEALVATQTELAALRFETLGIAESLTSTRDAVTSDINAVRNQVGSVQETVGSISGTVTTLEKLSTIDSELLRKYSKVYFLSENYTPAHLAVIPQDYVYSNSEKQEFVQEAWPHLARLLNAAKAGGVEFYIKSAFRSFNEQQKVKSSHVFTYGAGTANAFSADQGYSEHQLGTTVDFVAPGFQGALTEAFDDTEAFSWLERNAHKYGFTLSYPKGNTYYSYEPWHWRFVGVKLATHLYEQNKRFYDMDQRDIDTYLASLFDQ
jgi:LAS superfamily LD-carboxypeptidase LdcB